MNGFITLTLFALLISSIVAISACAPVAVPLPPHALVAVEPGAQAELIYAGDVFVEERSTPAFRYERLVEKGKGTLLTSTHLTRHAQTDVIAVVQSAVHTSEYDLKRFEEVHAQTGVVSTVDVLDGGGLEFVVTRGSDTKRVVESAGEGDVVVGPTLFGYVLRHWDVLQSGGVLQVRFAVTERAESYGFELRKASADAGTFVVEMKASSVWVRMATSPMSLTFDPDSRKILRYEGAVPPRGMSLESLEARVEYDFASDVYR